MDNENNKFIKTYYNGISIYLGNSEVEPILEGEVYIDKNDYCEGIITNENKELYFIFGTFKKYDFLDLYIINNKKVNRYCAKKNRFTYEGENYLIQNNEIVSKNDFYIKISELEMDPRDTWINPKEEFINKLQTFKEYWLLNDDNRSLYEKYNREKNRDYVNRVSK